MHSLPPSPNSCSKHTFPPFFSILSSSLLLLSPPTRLTSVTQKKSQGIQRGIMGMHVISYLRQTLKRKDKEKSRASQAYSSADSDWDFGARQTPDLVLIPSSSSTSSTRQARRRSISLNNVPRPFEFAEVLPAREPRTSVIRDSVPHTQVGI